MKESLIVRLLLVCIRTRILDNLPKSDCRGFLTGAFHQPSVIAHFNNSPYLANLQQLCRNNVKHIDDCLADLVVKLPGECVLFLQRSAVNLACKAACGGLFVCVQLCGHYYLLISGCRQCHSKCSENQGLYHRGWKGSFPDVQ